MSPHPQVTFHMNVSAARSDWSVLLGARSGVVFRASVAVFGFLPHLSLLPPQTPPPPTSRLPTSPLLRVRVCLASWRTVNNVIVPCVHKIVSFRCNNVNKFLFKINIEPRRFWSVLYFRTQQVSTWCSCRPTGLFSPGCSSNSSFTGTCTADPTLSGWFYLFIYFLFLNFWKVKLYLVFWTFHINKCNYKWINSTTYSSLIDKY